MQKNNQVFAFIWEMAKIVLISSAIVIPIRYFLVQPFLVRGSSMEPSFSDNQYLVIDEISYRFSDPSRGDVIIFKYPYSAGGTKYYIKRIIGLPGETVEIEGENVTIYNDEFPQGRTLDESSYLVYGDSAQSRLKIKLEQDEYFVMGDNRAASSDSRQWGPLKESYVVGRVWLRAWPFDELSAF